ncbi:MAG: Eco57I restriction-modification methylase domain-containing protein [Bacteroidetes bacterium]|nr:Eco57I restriction-modification methylase domain-containing protein [Bacteroidota bacterium]
MDKKTLQNSILEKAYQPEKWLDVMKDYFGAKKFHQKPQSISLPNNDVAENAVELGSFYTADERLVGMYEVHLKPKAWLDKNRVGLRNLLRQVYKYDVDGALIVFVQGEKWRFSFVSEIRTAEGKKETEPKRYTYLFGEGESCRTAAERFDKLKGKSVYLADLFDAFSVDKLNKDFFKSYKEFFEKFSAHLASNTNYRKLILGSAGTLEKGWQDEAAKPIRDFSKKLLGRIVFLQFLQKKGWMGVPTNNEKWSGGDAKFLQNLFLNYADKEHFHSKALKTLFFETLNRKRTNQLAPVALGSNIRIPYLNGGLFDKDVSFDKDIDFPADLFRNLLEFFESYNFTIDENDPYDSEVGIDPEMLGHIFENLLEENREKGAFYTPKGIVHYMCQESLIQYLRTHLPECTEDESPATKALENFIRNGIIGDRNDKKNFVVQQAKRIEKLLDKVKICDPAIGSGAFPMGMLQEIFKAKTALDLTLDHAEAKKQIIQNCIYGVDIENGAVEIARLRFWLALVVDEEEPQPLPNLDYKIMQGNSLLESFEGIDLSRVHTVSKTTTIYEPQRDIFGNVLDPQLKFTDVKVLQENNLQELMQDFFSETDPEKKQAQRELINQTVHEHIDYNLELWQRSLERQIAEAPDSNKQGLKAATKKRIEELHKQLEGLIEKRKKLHELQNAVNKPYFLWYLFFADVFEKGGFDIVIGNPPYIQLQKMGKDADTLKEANFKTFERTGDIYMLFFEQGYKYLKPKGNLVFITGSAWLRSNYGKSLRNFFLENTNGKILIDLSDAEVFESATVLTTIHLFTKEKNKGELKALRLTKKNQEFIKALAANFESQHTVLKDLTENAWVIADAAKQHINQKVSKQGKKLKDWDIEINYGIKTGLNEAFVIDDKTKQELIKQDPKSAEIIKPLLRGRDLGRYSFKSPNLWLIGTFPTLKIDINHYPAIKKHLLSFGKEKLEQSGEKNARKKTSNEWFETQDQIGYWKNFEKPKIIYPNMVKDLSFTFDEDGFYLNDKCFILNGQHLQYLVAYLNSKLFRYCFEDDFPELQGNSREIKGFVMKEIPVKEIDTKTEKQFEQLTKKVLHLSKQGLDSRIYENKIDALVFHLYGLTEQEMLQVLETFKDLSIKDRNQIQNEYWNIANNKFQLEK